MSKSVTVQRGLHRERSNDLASRDQCGLQRIGVAIVHGKGKARSNSELGLDEAKDREVLASSAQLSWDAEPVAML